MTDEALTLLEQYDLHASAGMMVHFAIANAAGRSVAVEYIDNEMSVAETPVVTNFYLTSGEKYGIGTEESHRRYEQRQQEQLRFRLCFYRMEHCVCPDQGQGLVLSSGKF